MKHFFQVLFESLTDVAINNKCQALRYEIRQWTPVFKKGDKTDWGNYQPVTVLNSVDKGFESLLFKQIIKTMNPHPENVRLQKNT